MNCEILCPAGSPELDTITRQVLPVFSPEAVAFVDGFSRRLLGGENIRRFPELAALGFWMRRARIEALQQSFAETVGTRHLQGRGVAFHVAPANVDTLFIYSWFLSLLVGNANLVRISARASSQLDLILEILDTLLRQPEFAAIRRRTLLVRYGHDDALTTAFSARCDVRILWGGDATITHLRTLPLPATAIELPFADKFSLAVLDARAFLEYDKQEQLVADFYNDVYWFSQLACSSPRLVTWVGDAENNQAAARSFRTMLEHLVTERQPETAPATVMDKLVAASCLAVDQPGIRLERERSGALHWVHLRDPAGIDADRHCGGGLLYELFLEDPADLLPWLHRRHQTVTSFGIARRRWLDLLARRLPDGIDRIVPVGRALEFSVIWDGQDLLRALCREIVVDIPEGQDAG